MDWISGLLALSTATLLVAVVILLPKAASQAWEIRRLKNRLRDIGRLTRTYQQDRVYRTGTDQSDQYYDRDRDYSYSHREYDDGTGISVGNVLTAIFWLTVAAVLLYNLRP